MLRMLPDYYRKSSSTIHYLEALTHGLSALSDAVADRTAQLWIQTATWMLPRYEEIFGIAASAGTIDTRRAALLAKLAARGTCTAERIRRVAAQYTNANIEVIEHFADYAVEVVLSGIDTPPRMAELSRSLREILPAHLGLCVHLKLEEEGTLHVDTAAEMAQYIVIWPWLVSELESTGTAAISGVTTAQATMEIYPQEEMQHV